MTAMNFRVYFSAPTGAVACGDRCALLQLVKKVIEKRRVQLRSRRMEGCYSEEAEASFLPEMSAGSLCLNGWCCVEYGPAMDKPNIGCDMLNLFDEMEALMSELAKCALPQDYSVDYVTFVPLE